ncbi:type 1 glutamine amidotransferase domain-containing protein [Hazenella sp. IB182357]|uniref:Type 1 glutamine amidotransferase domain-containing protein n=1 Tax=Polycladospora coralii TaxID=2771432 RepID=A0A926N7M7_9BACL|nr:type 1 glutamine amidotransferase domain-containing protein [Polycladospora coralii]MBD1370988.1 type 1 glutamine amidotransferase domain-containing protein [Polycladospora coralii]MBS7529927.1 type 1 glutamine amidotransferase domain-containing protein [Polycladospora coralii]
MAKILMVISNGVQVKNYKTGYWSEEFRVPLTKFEEAGHHVTIASSRGGDGTVDQISLDKQFDPNRESYEFEKLGRNKDTVSMSSLNGRDFDVILFVGGHGPMFDVAYDPNAHRLINEVYDNGGIVGAECHAPAVLAFTYRDGKSIIADKKVTAYPDAYEPDGVFEFLPYSVEQELTKVATYVAELDHPALAIWADAQIVTSRDQNSSEKIADEILKKLQ